MSVVLRNRTQVFVFCYRHASFKSSRLYHIPSVVNWLSFNVRIVFSITKHALKRTRKSKNWSDRIKWSFLMSCNIDILQKYIKVKTIKLFKMWLNPTLRLWRLFQNMCFDSIFPLIWIFKIRISNILRWERSGESKI